MAVDCTNTASGESLSTQVYPLYLVSALYSKPVTQVAAWSPVSAAQAALLLHVLHLAPVQPSEQPQVALA
jgi:hypothetical protein